MNTEPYAKEIEDALAKEIGAEVVRNVAKGNSTRLGNITLAVELDNVIESLQTRIRHMETIKSAVEQLKNTL